MKSLIGKAWNLKIKNLSHFNNLKSITYAKNFEESYQKNNNEGRLNFSIMFGVVFTALFLNEKLKCQQQQNIRKQLNKQAINVDIYQLNKSHFLQLLGNINQQGILIVFNKYSRNQKTSQFQKSLQIVYNKCRQLGISKIYLVDKNDIRHLKTFQRWLSNQIKQNSQKSENKSQRDVKSQYFFFSPDFPSSPFKIQQKDMTEQVSEIRKYKINLNPIDLNEQIFEPFKKIFNKTTVIQQCPEYIPPSSQNKCIEDYRKQITTLIQQGMLKNKTDEYKFFALTPKSKKDNSQLLAFHKILKQMQQKQGISPEHQVTKNQESHRNQNIFVLKNDILGKDIQNMKDLKTQNYSMLKNLTNYQKFVLFIKPRIFIISKANPSVDLYWYVTCLHKNKKASISINNTDSFNLGKKFPITDGLSYPQNTDLQFLKELYKNHPEFNYLIVNTEVVSQLIRHLPTKKKYVIYDLTSNIHYPKIFLPNYNHQISPAENYNLSFKSQIQRFLAHPNTYDQIVLDKQKKINSKSLKQIMENKNQQFVLRVCKINCNQDLSDEKLSKLSQKFQKSKQNQTQKDENLQAQNLPKSLVNQVYKNTYWIDSAFNNIGLKESDYVYSKGQYEEI